MFQEMRRKRQALSQEEISDVLEKGTSGVLALSGVAGYPYAVPLSYVYDGEKIYFHCAKSGYKLDAIRGNGKASFCVVAQDQIVPEEYTTYFKSVIVFGQIEIIEEEGKKREAIEKLAAKYAPHEKEEKRREAIDREWENLCMLEMHIDYKTGKEAIELVKKNKKINSK